MNAPAGTRLVADPLERLFGAWLAELAPGEPDRSRAASELILYRSAEPDARAEMPGTPEPAPTARRRTSRREREP